MYKIEFLTPDISMANFTDFSINKSIYQLANTGRFVALQKDLKDLNVLKKTVNKGLQAQIKIDDELALTGFVAEVKPSYWENKPSITIKINSKASQLVGASVVNGKYYLKQSFFAIAQDLVASFGIKIINQSSNKELIPAFVTSAIDDIDVILNRLAQLTNSFIYSNAAGDLVIADKLNKKMTNSALITGENVSDIQYFKNTYNDFDAIIFDNQQSLEDDLSLEQIINNRMKLGSADSKRCKHKSVDVLTTSLLDSYKSELANQAFDLQILGSSLKTTDNRLFDVNTAVIVKDKWLELNDTFLISDLHLQGGENGYQAKLKFEEFSHE